MNSYLANRAKWLAENGQKFSNLDNECILWQASNCDGTPFRNDESSPVTVDGSLMLFLCEGEVNVSINSETYVMKAPAVVSAHHTSRFEVSSDCWDGVKAWVIEVTLKLIQDVNLSFSSVINEAFFTRTTPVVELTEEESKIMLQYNTLMASVINNAINTQLCRHILSNLMGAMFYQVVMASFRQLSITATGRTSAARNNYVHEFMKLLHMNFTKERSVNFYAEHLFISPKYLSLLVKEATGRSAARWIDFFVINEAKNLLRYSGKNIQQVAYALNFPNQSSFGKYFKHITGQSPTQFQKN